MCVLLSVCVIKGLLLFVDVLLCAFILVEVVATVTQTVMCVDWVCRFLGSQDGQVHPSRAARHNIDIEEKIIHTHTHTHTSIIKCIQL